MEGHLKAMKGKSSQHNFITSKTIIQNESELKTISGKQKLRGNSFPADRYSKKC